LSVAIDSRSTQRRGRGERGAALVELALASTLLLTLLFGIIECGYVLSFKQGLTQAAAEGARQAAVGGDYAGAVGRAVNAFNKTCGSGGLTCTYTPSTCSTSHTCLQISLSYDWKNHPLLPTFPGLGLLLPDTLTSSSTVQTS
jgi:Flp pilus assembly protein TadG